ncbi:MAG: O-antigen ligase family protein [Bacteroidales bacterium]|nr:O-antigen ligase family protein [Bacteroidales bacterium]
MNKTAKLLEINLMLFAIAIVFSNTLMTIADIMLICITAFCVVEKLRRKESIKVSYSTLIPGIVFLAIAIGALYSTDKASAVTDIMVKLPLLIFPVTFSLLPVISESTRKRVIIIHCLSLLVASGIVAYNNFFTQTDFRQLYPYISHIRLALNFCASILFLTYYLITKGSTRPIWKAVSFAIIIWFTAVLFMLKSISGLGILVILFICLVFSRRFFKSLGSKTQQIISILFIILLLAGSIFLTYSYTRYYHGDLDISDLPEYTINGNKYSHNIDNGVIEEGENYNILICDEELRKEWNSISDVDYDGKTKEGTELKATLVRYLNSLDLPKDSIGVHSLTHDNVDEIEMGYANACYNSKFSLYSRMSMLFFSYENYKRTGNPSGSTLLQRFCYWDAGFRIWKDHPVFGVGTGDVRDELDKKYATDFPRLDSIYRLNIHNQYLQIAVQLGIAGLIIFLFCIIYPGVASKSFKDFRWRFFLILIMLSMLNEDTLGTQAGVTLFCLFYFLFLSREETTKKAQKNITS